MRTPPGLQHPPQPDHGVRSADAEGPAGSMARVARRHRVRGGDERFARMAAQGPVVRGHLQRKCRLRPGLARRRQPPEHPGERLGGRQGQMVAARDMRALTLQYGLQLRGGEQPQRVRAHDDPRPAAGQAVRRGRVMVQHGGAPARRAPSGHVQYAPVAGANAPGPQQLMAEADGRERCHRGRYGDGRNSDRARARDAGIERQPTELEQAGHSIMKMSSWGDEVISGQNQCDGERQG